MKCKQPLKRKKPWKRGKPPKNKRPLRKMSEKQQARMKEYIRVRLEFLGKPENKWCAVCKCLNKEDKSHKINLSSEVHHKRGRAGDLLCDTRFFIATCRACRRVPHDRIAWARDNDLLASPANWNSTVDLPQNPLHIIPCPCPTNDQR